MSFAESLPAFTYLSELYRQDAPDSVLLAEYPSSNNTDTALQNRGKYIIHDPFPPPPTQLIKYLGPHHLMCGWGDGLRVSSEIRPQDALLDHWREVLGENAVPHWTALNDDDRYTTIFPHESLAADRQEIDPATLYHLHSKQAIAEIGCPQAPVLDDIAYPCVLKLSHGYAGLGNFFIRDDADARRARDYIDTHWPGATYVINGVIGDIARDYCVQFYLHRNGRVTWLGFTNQVFDDAGKWSGGTFVTQEQDDAFPRLFPLARKTGDYLHEHGYYGVVGIDVLEDGAGERFLVDLNPRLNGSTPFLVLCRRFLKGGDTAGLYAPSRDFPGTLAQLAKRAANAQGGKAVILSACEDTTNGVTKCHLSAHAPTLADCRAVMDNVLSSISDGNRNDRRTDIP